MDSVATTWVYVICIFIVAIFIIVIFDCMGLTIKNGDLESKKDKINGSNSKKHEK